MSLFVLRQYCPVKKTNKVIGSFNREGSFVLENAQPSVVYQIYPGELDKTFYNIDSTQCIVAYANETEYLGRTDDKDLYLYFQLKEARKNVNITIRVQPK